MEAIGIVASDRCRDPRQEGKQWFHLNRFAITYCDLLASYRIVAPDATAALLQDSLSGLQGAAAKRFRGNIESVGESFRGMVGLAARVARGEIRRVLMFQDPFDLAIERPENYALLRNCNLAGAHLCINGAAHLWALYECHKQGIPQEWEYVYDPVTVGEVRETVAFIAHDGQKERMARFAILYRDVLRTFPRLVATSGTRDYIADRFRSWVPGEPGLEIEVAGETQKVSHGPSGGDVIIADEIFSTYRHFRAPALRYALYAFWNVLFFVDHKTSHPHEPDIQVLLKTCVNPIHRVNLILNSHMAAEWATRYRERIKPTQGVTDGRHVRGE